MLWYVAGNKTDHTIIETAQISIDLSNTNVRDSFISALSGNHGVSVSDISLYYVSSTEANVARIQNGDSWALTWDDDAPTGEISGVSFAEEDAKKWLQFSADKTTVIADEKDTLTVSVSVLTANKSGVDTSVSGSVDIPVTTPDGGIKARFAFLTGKASKSFKFSKPGVFRAGLKMTSYRMDNELNIDVLL